MKTSSAGAPNSIFQTSTSKTITSSAVTSQPEIFKKSKDYYAKLKGLNESVAKWVNQHVNANPFINLTPVFRDYEKYINELESSEEAEKEKSLTQLTPSATETKTFTTTTSKTETQKEISTFTFKPNEESKVENKTSIFTNTKTTKMVEVDEESDKPKTAKFSFGSSSPNTFSFSFSKTTLQPTSTGFSFGGDTSKPFTFSNVTKPVTTEENKEENEDEEEPPKVEFTPVVEEGHIYTVRCKLFVKKEGKFTDRGVGNLFLKPVPDNDKVQLIMRADTSLGNLLCNLILSTNVPMQRMGNKDVMLVCIPTPDSKPPPVPILFRVKSSEEADELLRTLEKHRK
ncbi:hypothetical protein ILUMI_04653 [Ignelater luminosus]|uniref:RanBD1 domain-containing protein n=1 Tax=Ignelater luminosus TaxID=2038154 RepID=A0A8K0DDG2_IGNLU|nr:hypothetical protein ILUMI_04653 [Ignelater luminosus]